MAHELARRWLYVSKHDATCMIDNKLVVLTEPNLRLFSENTSVWLQLKYEYLLWTLRTDYFNDLAFLYTFLAEHFCLFFL